MKFIFPQNYNFKNKLFGLMDYLTATINIIWAVLILIFLNIFHFKINIKIGLFITLYFPLLLFSIFGFNNENIIYVFSYLFRFFTNRRIYFFSKD